MALHIGNRIRKVFEKSGMTVSEFARRINKSRENAYSIFRRKSIDTELLEKISSVLKYDFFEHYHPGPQQFTDSGGIYLTKYQVLKEEVKKLQKEIKSYQRQLDDLREKYELSVKLNKALGEKKGK